MGGSRIEIAPALVAKAQHLFEQTLTPKKDIAAKLGISPDTLRRRVREWRWKRRPKRARPAHVPPAAHGAAADGVRTEHDDPLSAERRTALATRIMTFVEREMADLELAKAKADPSDLATFDSNRRAFAGIMSTLRELTALHQPEAVDPPDEASDDAIPRDIDEFREELARRINAFVDSQQDRADGVGVQEAGAGLVAGAG
jgi:hypothetical protein